MVNAPESTCHYGVASTVFRDPSRAPSARLELPEKKEPLSFLGKSSTVYFLKRERKERKKDKINEQEEDNRIFGTIHHTHQQKNRNF